MGGGQGEAREERLFGLEQLNGGKGGNDIVFIIFLSFNTTDHLSSITSLFKKKA